jgi:hypothetical protein
MRFFKEQRKFWQIVLLCLLVLACILVAIRVVDAMDNHQIGIDFYNFWLAGHLVSQGQSPYNTVQWVAGYPPYQLDFDLNPAFLLPLPLALLFVPLGWLPFHSAFIVWVTLLQLMIILALGMLLAYSSHRWSKLLFIPLLAGIVLFRPTILTLFQGQVSAVLLLVLVVIARLWDRQKWFAGGVLLGLLVLKPNLGVIIIALLGFWLLLHSHWKAVLGVAASSLVLLLAGLAYDPNWIVEYWSIGGHKLVHTFGGSPTLWGLSALIFHHNLVFTLIFGGIAAALLVLGFLWLVVRRKNLHPVTIIALVVTLTLLCAPYTWTYDQVLLIIPLTLVALAIDRPGFRSVLAAALFTVIDALVLILLILDTGLQIEILNVFVPLVVLGLHAWSFKRTPA